MFTTTKPIKCFTMLRTCIGTAVVATILCSCSTDYEQKCKEQAQLGSKSLQSNQFSQAEHFYQAAADLAKNSANALQYPLMLRELSRAQIAQGKLDTAAQNLQLAVDYYDGLPGKSASPRFDQSVVNEREYEALASLGDVLVQQHKDMEAKHAYARAIALGSKIVEPPSIAEVVNQNYVNVLEKTGDHALAAELQADIDSSSSTVIEFDERYNTVVAAILRGQYANAEKQLERLQRASRKFIGDTARLGKVESYLGFMQIARNAPDQAEVTLRDSINMLPRRQEYMGEICHSYALWGLARELQGDTKSGIEFYRKAFSIDPFLQMNLLIQTSDALLKSGHPAEANRVRSRVAFLYQDPGFKAIPVTSLDFVMLSNVQNLVGQTALARQTQINGLTHLEHESSLTGFREMRGALHLYRSFAAAQEPKLAKRALRQLYIIGERSPQGKVQLQKLLQREHLPPSPPG
ncbi:MAG: hypothetical protein JST44_14360 [Cyanobacteria bacterium SZAS LIN-5]|nr:hypothetical protein [Cyanobacteria bacterium SZAS LIN-5]